MLKYFKIFYFDIINSTHRKNFIFLAFLSIIAMILEVLGIGAVYPILLNIVGFDYSNILLKYESLDFLVNLDQRTLLYFFILFLILIYFLKTMFFIFFYWYRAKFMRYLNSDISQDLYNKYLKQPYSFHLRRTSGNLMRNTNQTVGTFVLGYIDAILLYITQGLILIGISTVLIFLQPLPSLFAIIFFILLSLFYLKISKKWVINLGKIRTIFDGLKIKLIQHGLGGAKEIKISGNEKNFFKSYSEVNNEIARVSVFEDLLKTIPKLSIEFIAVLFLCIFLITLVLSYEDPASTIPILGIYAAAGFRIIPSINGLIFAQTKLRSNAYVIEIISKDLTLENEEIDRGDTQEFVINSNDFIKIRNLTYSYENAKKILFTKLNLKIEFLKSTGIIGKSGSGKTTLVDLILGLLDPSDGSITVNDINIHKNKKSWQKNIGYVSQDIFLSDDTIKENIALGEQLEKIDNTKLNNAVRLSKINDFLDDLPNGLDTKIGDRGVRLSGGQRQRIGIARAIYKNAKILVLDEATSSLDMETEKEVIKSIENLHGRLTIIIISHRLSAVEKSDKIIELKKGQIIYEGPYNKS